MPPTLWQNWGRNRRRSRNRRIGSGLGQSRLGENEQDFVELFNLVFGEVIDVAEIIVTKAQESAVVLIVFNPLDNLCV